MPYTPPAARSPTASRPTTPRSESFQKQHQQSHGSKQELPHSSSSKAYLSKHRRSPSISDSNTVAPFGSFAKDTTVTEPKKSDGEDHQRSSKSTVKSLRQPRFENTETSTATTGSPNGSPTHSSSEDEPTKRRGRLRDVADLAELQAAIRIIEQHRSGSPDDNASEETRNARSALELLSPRTDGLKIEDIQKDMGQRRPLSDAARKISHSRSSTDASAFIDFPRNKFVSPARSTSASDAEDDEDDDDDLQLKPSLIRKKSGELVRPALRASSTRRRPSSMPGTPTYSKAVHFQENSLEHVRHFLQVDRPIAVSAGTSPVESNGEEDNEFPFFPAFDWEIRLTNFPRDPLRHLTYPVKTEKVYLSTDTKTLIGAVAVRNLAFHKLVVVRFTLDYWKTTSEVVAEYNNDVRKKLTNEGYDRFTFNIKLEDQANLENKTMFFCIRYNVNGQDYWDNNNNLNYQIDFSKKYKQTSQTHGNRPLNALPRSKPISSFSNASPSMRPRSMPSFDDFASNMAPYELSSFPNPAAMVGDSPIRFRNKPSAAEILPDAPGKPKPSSNQQAFGNRYDFGASLSAAMTAKTAANGEKVGSPIRTAARPVQNAPVAKTILSTTPGQNTTSSSEAKLGISTGPKPAMNSLSYEQMIANYCFAFGSAPKGSSPPAQIDQKKTDSQVDGPSVAKPKPEEPKASLGRVEAWVEHVEQTKPAASPAASPVASPVTSTVPYQTSTPLAEERKSPKVSSPRPSRTASPANSMGSRAGSPNAFGYPYHQPMQNGFFEHTPTAIRG